jgi:thiopurine S-methyltransferase
MDAEFWQQRWANNQIGFHQRRINGYLENHWSRLELRVGAQVFVPLCGKSRDMLWLAGQGYPVLGVELAEQALLDFFKENELTVQRGNFPGSYEADGLSLHRSDVFEVPPGLTAHCEGFYDRAALIALPPATRERYVRQLTKLLKPGTKGLLISLEYPQDQKDGPPFSVPDNEVRHLFGGNWQVELLQEDDMLHRNERFREQGISFLIERAYCLTRR